MINWDTIDEFASADDWACAFGEESYTSSCKPFDFKRSDVAEVIKVCCHDGERYDGPPFSTDGYYGQIDMHGCFRLSDGRFVYIEAGADTTGWGCQDYNHHEVADTLDALIPKMGDKGRLALGYATGIGSNHL